MWSFQNVQGYLCPGFREGSYHLWDPFSTGDFWCNLLAISLLIQCTFLSGPIQAFSFHGILPLPVSCDFVGNCPILLRCNLFFMVFSLPIPNSHSTSDALLRLTCPLELVSFLFSHLIHRYWVPALHQACTGLRRWARRILCPRSVTSSRNKGDTLTRWKEFTWAHGVAHRIFKKAKESSLKATQPGVIPKSHIPEMVCQNRSAIITAAGASVLLDWAGRSNWWPFLENGQTPHLLQEALLKGYQWVPLPVLTSFRNAHPLVWAEPRDLLLMTRVLQKWWDIIVWLSQ